MVRVGVPGSGLVKQGASGDERERPVVSALILEPDEQDPLPLAETECAVAVGNLLGTRAEQQLNEADASLRLEGHEPFEQTLEIVEEPGFALLHAHERWIAVRRHVRDSAAAVRCDLTLDVVRDVENREARHCRGDRDRDFDGCHDDAATSLGSRKWTSSRATVTSSSSSQPCCARRAIVASTSSSGVDAPAVMPIVSWPSSRSMASSLSPSINSASAPALRATSTSRCAFELVCEPITRIN